MMGILDFFRPKRFPLVYIVPDYREALVFASYLENRFKNNERIAICILFATSGDFEYRNAQEQQVNFSEICETRSCVLLVGKGKPEYIFKHDRDFLIKPMFFANTLIMRKLIYLV